MLINVKGGMKEMNRENTNVGIGENDQYIRKGMANKVVDWYTDQMGLNPKYREDRNFSKLYGGIIAGIIGLSVLGSAHHITYVSAYDDALRSVEVRVEDGESQLGQEEISDILVEARKNIFLDANRGVRNRSENE
jgi:hypothetical protein